MAAKWAWSNSGIGSMILEKLWKTSKDHTFLRQMIVRRGKCSRLWFRVNVFFLISRDDSPFSSVFACNVADLPPPKEICPLQRGAGPLLLCYSQWILGRPDTIDVCQKGIAFGKTNSKTYIYIYIVRKKKLVFWGFTLSKDVKKNNSAFWMFPSTNRLGQPWMGSLIRY